MRQTLTKIKLLFSEHSQLKTKSVTGVHSEKKGIRIHYDQCDIFNYAKFLSGG
jgi:hypothetical protein